MEDGNEDEEDDDMLNLAMGKWAGRFKSIFTTTIKAQYYIQLILPKQTKVKLTWPNL